MLASYSTDRGELASLVGSMTSTLVHRGPDQAGIYASDRIALGSRRLKVIDLATGQMPIANETGSVVVVYNGEIYNYRTLGEQLRRRGHVFKTQSDTEILVHLYEDVGIELTSELVGMFAFALWDGESETLYLVRDRLGIKPLYYAFQEGTTIFGSELKSLLAVARTRPEIDREAVVEYLAFGYIRAPRTIYRDYKKLPPGCVLAVNRDGASISRYWSFPTSQASVVNPEEAVDRLDEILNDAVRERLVADVPLGCFLSGGIDSSTVVAIAAAHTTGPIKTFAVGFAGRNELEYARTVANHLGTEHHELSIQPEECRVVDSLLDYFDEPFGDSSAVPTYFLSELTRRHVTVALSGDGGDELFGGYDQYAHDARWAWLDKIPPLIRSSMSGAATRVLPFGAYGWNLLRALSGTREERYALYVTSELDHRLGGLLHPDLAGMALRPSEFFATTFETAGTLSCPAKLLYADATNYLPDDILTKVDRMSMAHSLEARVPLLDHRLVEFAASLPAEWKLRDGERKWIFKRLAARYLPQAILDRPKHGFTIPVNRWMKRELADMLDRLLSPAALSGTYLHRPTVERLIREHRSDRRDHSYVLWRLVVLEKWLERFAARSVGEGFGVARATGADG
jgi:asparagine synthase (glutamine-hydrolysing)